MGVLAVGQTVDVDATVPLLQSKSSAMEGAAEYQTITNMPVIDRRSSQLQRLSGFVVGNGTGSSATFALGAGRGDNSNYLVDGGNLQNLLLGVPNRPRRNTVFSSLPRGWSARAVATGLPTSPSRDAMTNRQAKQHDLSCINSG